MARQGGMGVEELILQRIASLRRWKKTKLYRNRSKWDFPFTVMTYNILSQKAVENHRYLYQNCNPTYLQEGYRISRIMPEILKSKSDIICLQEVEQTAFLNMMKGVFDSNGFSSIFKRRTGSRSDGCAILWRRTKFDLVQQKDVEFRTSQNELLNRDNIGLIAVLKPNHPKLTNTLLHVATTHLLFNPRRGDIKLCQLRWFFAELERLALKEVKNETRHYHPVIFCGDLNIEPFSPLYQFIETGRIDVKGAVSGNLSGQAAGKDKGGKIFYDRLLLHKLGISDSSRFEEMTSHDKKSRGFSKATCWRSDSESPQSKDAHTSSGLTNSGDANILAAMGSSNDPRWIATLLAMGQKQLADELSARLQVDSKRFKGLSEPVTDSEVEEDGLYFYHDFKFVPAYKYQQSNQDIPVTSVTGNDRNNVDHIFYGVNGKRNNRSFLEGPLKLLSLYSLLKVDEVMELSGLPNAALGSDHICLMAKFALCPHK